MIKKAIGGYKIDGKGKLYKTRAEALKKEKATTTKKPVKVTSGRARNKYRKA